MKEKPIIFSGLMVREILAGRKMQTRHVVKMQGIDYGGCGGKDSPEWDDPRNWGYEHEDGTWSMLQPGGKEDHQIPCPYGAVGDRLWVREAWRRPNVNTGTKISTRSAIIYRATFDYHDGFGEGWRPSIHMPRWASRITLEITGLRVERLRSITSRDVVAEGFPFSSDLDQFKTTWNHINGKQLGCDWESNPFVFVISFSVLQK